MKRKKAEKLIIPFATILIFALFFGSIAYALVKAPARTPSGEIDSMSDAYSRVLYTGKGYHTSDIESRKSGETAKVVAEVLEVTKEEKKREEQRKKEKEEKKKEQKKKETSQEQEQETNEPDNSEDTNQEQEEQQEESEDQDDKEDEEGDSQDDDDSGSEEQNDEEDEDSDGSGGDANTENYDDDDSDSGENSGRTDSDDDDADQEGAEKPQEESKDPDEGKYPIIATDLEDGEVVSQKYRTFFVRATNYKGKYLDASHVTVTVIPAGGESKKLYSTSDDGYKVGYKLNMDADMYTVTIKATDKKGLSSIATYTIKKGEADEPVPDGDITFSLEASTVGLGTLIGPVKVEFYQGEQLPYVIDRALKEHGYTYRYKGDYERGFYLKHVVKNGITDGAKIPDDLLEKLEEAGYTPSDYHQDSLGEYDFSGQAGWIYSVNGANMSTGMSSYYPADGDEVRIRFSLYNGADIGGGVGTGSFGKEW